MRLNPVTASEPARRHGDIDPPAIVGSNAPELCRAPMTQDSFRPAGQNCSNENTTPVEIAVTDGIDPLVQAVKPPPPDSRFDRVGFEPERDQLPQSNHPVLPLGQFGDLTITWM
jgi:hypothetical protein